MTAFNPDQEIVTSHMLIYSLVRSRAGKLHAYMKPSQVEGALLMGKLLMGL